jgi:hypothetical protein
MWTLNHTHMEDSEALLVWKDVALSLVWIRVTCLLPSQARETLATGLAPSAGGFGCGHR